MLNFIRFIMKVACLGFTVGVILKWAGLSLPQDPDAELNAPLGWFIGCILGAGWWLVRRPKKEIEVGQTRVGDVISFALFGICVAEMFKFFDVVGDGWGVAYIVCGVLWGIFGWWLGKKFPTKAIREEEKISE